MKRATRFMVMGIVGVLSVVAFAQYGQYSSRSLLEKKVFYVAGGKIGSASFWSLPIGRFDCKLNRYFPGEDTIQVDASINFALLSSGYIDGSGYGSKGKIGAMANFAVQDGDTLKKLELADIEYVYQNGATVKPKGKPACPLLVMCETPKNQFTIRSMQIMLWRYDNTFKELKHDKDVGEISAFAFTQAEAQRAANAK